jgi:hypothetical protein
MWNSPNAGCGTGARPYVGRALLAAAMLVSFCMPDLAGAAPTERELCAQKKLKASARFSRCRSAADAEFKKTGKTDKRDRGYERCELDFRDKYDAIEAKWPQSQSLPASDQCSTYGDASNVLAFLIRVADGIASGNASTLGGDTFHGMPATGQTVSYGNGTDGDLQPGSTRTFTDNGDGTIADAVTGLMWEKKSDDGSVHDVDNAYEWELYPGCDTTPTNQMTGSVVNDFLDVLNDTAGGGASGFAGFTDWRVPNLHELRSLIDHGGSTEVQIFDEFNTGCAPGCAVTDPGCSCVTGQATLTSTTWNLWNLDETYFAAVDFWQARHLSWSKCSFGFGRPVRAVRGGLLP